VFWQSTGLDFCRRTNLNRITNFMRHVVVVSRGPSIIRTSKKVIEWVVRNTQRRSRLEVDATHGLVGIASGRNLYTSLRDGELSIHGSAQSRIWDIARVRGLGFDAATVEYLWEHCRRLKALGAKNMFGLAWSLKVDPNEIGQRTGRAIDIDRALTSAAGEACSKISKDIFGKGNPTFLLVISHGTRTFVASTPVALPETADEKRRSPTREHVLVRVLLLAPADKRKAASGDEEAWIAKWDKDEVRQQAGGVFAWSLIGPQDEKLQTIENVGMEWKALITEACAKTVEELRQNGELIDFKAAAGRVISRFKDQFRTMTRDTCMHSSFWNGTHTALAPTETQI